MTVAATGGVVQHLHYPHSTSHLPAPPPPAQPEPQPQQTQSWAAWLLDAYAVTATSPATSEFPHEGDDDYYESYEQEQQQQNIHPITHRQQQRWFSDSDALKRGTTVTTTTTTSLSPDTYPHSHHHTTMRDSSSTRPQPSLRAVSAQNMSVQGYGPGLSPTTSSFPQKQPFARTGRGGAGNFVWGSLGTGRASVVVPDSANPNVDQAGQTPSLAQRRAAARKLQRLDTVGNGNSKAVAVNAGRGGAGNYTVTQQSATSPASKSPLSSTYRISDDATASVSASTVRSVSTPATTISSSTTSGYGRGGAGNQAKAEEEKERKELASYEREVQDVAERRRAIEEQVDEWLMPPPVARVGLGGRSGSWIY